MAWGAKITSVTTNGGNVVATLLFEDSSTGETIAETLRGDNLTSASIAQFVHAKMASLAARDSAAAALEPLVGQGVTPVAPSAAAPIPSTELLAWSAQSGRLDRMKQAEANALASESVRALAAAAVRLIERDSTSLDLRLTDRQQMVAALVAAGVLTQADSDSLYALAGV